MSDPSTWPINSYVQVPPELRAGLRIYSTAQRYEIAVALGRAMRLKLNDDPTAHTWSYLYGLVDPLVEAIQEGSMLLENRAPRIARKAMNPLDVGDLTHVLMELGWGSHERHFPADGRHHASGCKAAIYLTRPGASTRVRTWTPLAGPIHGFLITHSESISLADYLTIGDGNSPEYRPTVHYAYHPSDDTVQSVHELAGRNWELQTSRRLVKDEIVSGLDELGVLLMGHEKGAYWYGSRLTIEEARRLAPHNSATSLQVTAPVVAGVIWAMRHPDRGVIEPEEMDHAEILDFIRPYLGQVVGEYSKWTPLLDRGRLFEEDLDGDDPWQFKNFRVV